MSGKRITKGLQRRLLERLAANGVLRLEHDKVLGLLPATTWPTATPARRRAYGNDCTQH